LVLTPQGETGAKLEGHGRAALGVVVSDDGQRLASVGLDETLRVWNAQTGESLGVCEGHDRPVNGAVFVRKGQFLVSVGGGRSKGGNDLKVWRSKDYADLGTLAAHRAPINGVVVSPDGEWLVTYSVDKSWKLWPTAALLKATGDSSALTIADLLLPPGLKIPAGKTGAPAATVPAPAAGPGAGAKTAEPPPPAERPEAPALPDGASFAAYGATALAAAPQDQAEGTAKIIRVGIIGLDTSHATAFTQILNDPNAKEDVARCKVVAAYPKGSPDIASSTSRVPGYIEEVKKHGVEIVDSIEALVAKVDAVLLETNDGRPHLEQILPVLKAGKPVFIDKPIAGSLTDAVAIFEAARHYKVPVFSSSSLRYSSGAQAIRRGETVGEVRGCDAYSPCSLEATHPELFWYGIHGV
ncbi:MAG: Gfo/Idh/MocA family oxidoreductase, partial [Planctomycetaceae bacterium]